MPAATARLKELGTYLTADATTEVPSWVSDRFSSSPLRPSDRNVIYRNNDFVVWRTKQSAVPREQRVGFLQAMAGLRKAFTTPDPHFSLHIYEVAAQGDTITTHAHVELDGPGDNGLVEVDCHWSVSWRQTSDDSSLQLLTIDVDAYEEVHLRRRKPWFADVTASVFRGTDSFTQQMALSNIYWRKRIERHHIIDKSGHHGVTVGDVNGDGLDDINVCQPGGLPNRLYVQTPDGTVEDLSSAAGCDFLDNTRSALIIDFDGRTARRRNWSTNLPKNSSLQSKARARANANDTVRRFTFWNPISSDPGVVCGTSICCGG